MSNKGNFFEETSLILIHFVVAVKTKSQFLLSLIFHVKHKRTINGLKSPKKKLPHKFHTIFHKYFTEELYTNKPFFKFLKQRWSTNFDSLEKYYFKMRIRFNETGETTRKFEHFPTFFRAARLEHGTWSTPYYDCDGKLPMWKIQYAAPFFGWDSLKAKLEFK